jgi:hypothetical protein
MKVNLKLISYLIMFMSASKKVHTKKCYCLFVFRDIKMYWLLQTKVAVEDNGCHKSQWMISLLLWEVNVSYWSHWLLCKMSVPATGCYGNALCNMESSWLLWGLYTCFGIQLLLWNDISCYGNNWLLWKFQCYYEIQLSLWKVHGCCESLLLLIKIDSCIRSH